MAFSLCFRSIIFLQLWCIPFCCGKANFQRLPTSVKPTLYELYFKPDLKTFKFDGNETVHLQILQSTNEIHINCLDIRINHVRLRLLPSGEVYAPDLFLDAKEETLKMTFKKELPPGEAKLSVEFTGELNTLMKGFYRSKYTSASGGEEKYCAVTQFEATDARRCFPCWDEPAIKARFDINLSIDKEMIALSNMPVEKEYIEGELKMVKFQRTPIMSTYLLAMVVGNFDYVEDKTPDGVVVRVYTPPGKKEQGRWALNVATKTLPYYKDYFNVAYPLPKMDLIGISDIAVGAMENWGLITYAETCLLVDQLQTSAGTKQNVALVVAHELAHQWFGNLVTMEWWSDLWLNEGYATFIEYLCVDFLFPEYDIWSQFVTDTYCDALESDALKNSHPIEAPVQHPAEINENFDRISYDKSGSVIRMLHRYIGDDDFRKGMNLYLTRYQYNNTVTEDLWSALEEACGKPVTSMMRTWTRQKGFPMITVEIADQDNNARTLVVSQTKFSADGSEKDDPTQWLVPLSFSKQSNPKEECSSAVLEGLQSKITISNISADDWIKVNPGAVGFYRTRYSDDMLNGLIPSISNKILPPVDRMNILDDLFALVMAGEADSVKLLDLMLAMIDEDDYNVWANIATYLDKFDNLLNNFPFHQQFKVYGLKLIKPISKKLGFEPKPEETHLVKLLRSLVLHCLVIFDDQEFLSVASDQFSHHISGKKAISPDLRLVVYRAVIAAQGKAAFLSLVKLFKKTDLLEEKGRILKSFFAIRSADLIDEALKFAESSDVSLANFVLALSSLSFSKAGREKTWQYVKDNWQSLYSKYPAGFLLSAIVRCTTENFVSDEKADEIEQFFKPKKIEGIERTLLQSLESIRINARWLRKEKDAVESYFEKFKS